MLTLFTGLHILLSANGAFANVNVRARIDLDFGTAAGDADLSGTIILDTADLASFTGGAYDMGGVTESGVFRVRANEPYTCTLPASITLTGPGTDMTVDSFTVDPGLSGGPPPRRIRLSVGGTLHLAAGQAAGDYSGSLTLTCDADDGNPTNRNDTITVLVTLLAPISISNTGELAFGTAAPTGVAGTITVAPDSGRTAVNVDLMGGTVSAAGFTVGGECGRAYTITLPGTGVIDAGGLTMTIDTFTDDSPGQPLCNPGDSFNVGATLHVGAGQAPGVYSGTFPVTAEYN